MAKTLSIIVPLGPNEREIPYLLNQLSELDEMAEIIIVAASGFSPSFVNQEFKNLYHYFETGKGRARQLNLGAKAARGGYLWFLHADCVLEAGWKENILSVLKDSPLYLFYSSLEFATDGPLATKWNAYLANKRSGFFKLPFGDQGYLMKKEIFDELGGYNEDCTYGEDHNFVWKAIKAGLPIRQLPFSITTSARKYRAQGWGRTTVKHVGLTIKQAIPLGWQVVKERGLSHLVRTWRDSAFKDPSDLQGRQKSHQSKQLGDIWEI